MSDERRIIRKGVAAVLALAIFMVLITLLRETMSTVPSIQNRLSMKTLRVNDFVLRVRVARTRAEQARSLNDVRSVPLNEGMIFVFERDGIHGVSTREMRFPVDVIWLDADGFVTGMQTDVLPRLRYPIHNASPARYVLMVNAGVARLADIDLHTYVYLPEFGY